MNQYEHLNHGFGPYINGDSEILILGSFPSVLSREVNFYYGNPRNRFWNVLEAVFEDRAGNDVETRKSFCKRHKVALYDVIEECDIIGSRDDSIENIVPSDIISLISQSNIKRIVLNGNAAKRYFLTYFSQIENVKIVFMPSTSPANAAWSLTRLIDVWKDGLIN